MVETGIWKPGSRKLQIRVENKLCRTDVHKVPDHEVWLDRDVIGEEIYERSDNSS